MGTPEREVDHRPPPRLQQANPQRQPQRMLRALRPLRQRRQAMSLPHLLLALLLTAATPHS
eukprot:623417-Pyramimonas_sp.AAC.1